MEDSLEFKYNDLLNRYQSLETSHVKLQEQLKFLIQEKIGSSSSGSNNSSNNESSRKYEGWGMTSDFADMKSYPGWGHIPGAYFAGSPYRKVFECMGHALHITRVVTGDIIFWNRAAEKLYEYKEHEALGYRDIDLIVSEEYHASALRMMDTLSNGMSWSGQLPMKKRSGKVFMALVTKSPLYEDGELASKVLSPKNGEAEEENQDVKADKPLGRRTQQRVNMRALSQTWNGIKSRRALRALKALVKLQALVRGHLIRKRTGDAHRQLQALVRAQTRARVGRIFNSGSPHSTIKSSHFSYSGPETPEICEQVIRARARNTSNKQILKRNGNYVPAKSHATPARRNLFQSYHLSLNSDQNCESFSTSKDSTARKTGLSPSPCELRSLGQLKFAEEDESVFCTAENSPQYYSASSMGCSSKRGTFTPTKSESSRSCLSGHLDRTPSYMAYTESSKAKVRSLSAPKQRLQYDRSSSTKRYSVNGHGDLRYTRTVALQNNNTNMAYPGSGRLDKLGIPVRGDVTGSSGRLWLRY